MVISKQENELDQAQVGCHLTMMSRERLDQLKSMQMTEHAKATSASVDDWTQIFHKEIPQHSDKDAVATLKSHATILLTRFQKEGQYREMMRLHSINKLLSFALYFILINQSFSILLEWHCGPDSGQEVSKVI